VLDSGNEEIKSVKPTRHTKLTLPKETINIFKIFPQIRAYKWASFDETVDIAVNLGVDPRKPNQSVKGVANLPSGTGKIVRVCVFASGPAAQAALEAGADVVGAEELIANVQAGIINFDTVIATPEMMPKLGKIGKILGPRGMMPAPKLGSVTNDVAKAIKAAKAGAVQFRVEKKGIIHAGIGKLSFSDEALIENVKAFMIAVNDVKPENFKGKYLKQVHLSSTMGPGFHIELSSVDPTNPKFMIDPAILTKK